MAIFHHLISYPLLLMMELKKIILNMLNFGLYFAANIYHEAVNPSSLKKRRLMERGGRHQEHRGEEH